MNNLMTREERITREKMLFLGRQYFQCYGGFKKDEFSKKMASEFKVLKFAPYNGNVSGSASLVKPEIILHKNLGKELNSFEIDYNIKRYRATILHELIHKMLIKRDEKGQIISTGFHKIIGKDFEFQKYLGTNLQNILLSKFNPFTQTFFRIKIKKDGFGVGANEGYTEWFRQIILKNEEQPTYVELSQVFFNIQKKLTEQGENAIEIMKDFKNGDYETFFKVLNMSKSTGILFIRFLDYLYVSVYEEDLIKKYVENKKIQLNLGKNINNEKILNEINTFCLEIENNCKEILGKDLSEAEILRCLASYVEESFEKRKEINKYVNVILNDQKSLENILDLDQDNLVKKEENERRPKKLFSLKKKRKYRNKMRIGFKKMVALLALSTLLVSSFKIKNSSSEVSAKNCLVYDIFDNLYEKINNLADPLKEKNNTVINKMVISDNKVDLDNSFSLDKGGQVFYSSYDKETVNMKYAYNNLGCDLVRVLKDGNILKEGDISEFEELFQFAIANDCDIRLRLGIKSSSDEMIYIAWVDSKKIMENYGSYKERCLLLKK